jgi:hypothetical protein
VFYLDHTFLAVRDLIGFALLTALSIWYIYTSVRLDVGVTPSAAPAGRAGSAPACATGFGEERRELHSTHSRQGYLAVVLALVFGYVWTMLAFDLDMALDMHFQSTLYGWWFFMTGWIGALMSFSLLVMAWRRYLAPTTSSPRRTSRPRQALLRLHGVLGLPHVQPVPDHLVREHGRGDALAAAPADRAVEGGDVRGGDARLRAPFFGLMSKAAKLFFPTFILFAVCSLLGTWLQRYVTVYPALYGDTPTSMPFGVWEIGVAFMYLGIWGLCYSAFMDAFPKMRVVLQTSPYRDEVQVPVDPKTMEPLPAHE